MLALGGGSFTFALERMVTALVIACPHALGLAVPLVVSVSTSLAAWNGLLIRDPAAFERARDLKAVVFDKTGTLTEGRFGVSDIVMLDGGDEGAALLMTGDAEGVVKSVANELGLDEYFAQVLPDQEAARAGWVLSKSGGFPGGTFSGSTWKLGLEASLHGKTPVDGCSGARDGPSRCWRDGARGSRSAEHRAFNRREVVAAPARKRERVAQADGRACSAQDWRGAGGLAARQDGACPVHPSRPGGRTG